MLVAVCLRDAPAAEHAPEPPRPVTGAVPAAHPPPGVLSDQGAPQEAAAVPAHGHRTHLHHQPADQSVNAPSVRTSS